jgi:glycosyltransferase involved in cell wall biosynthesis
MMSRDPSSNSPIRLALVTTELRPGGAERCLTNIALGLDREQFSPEVYSLAPEPPREESQLVDALRQADVPVHFLGARSKLQIFGAVRKLRALLEEQRPQVVQSFLFHANVVSAMATKNFDVPLFAGLRVAQPQTFRQFFDRRYARRFTKFVCVSQSVADHAADIGKLPREKLVVICNGIDLAAREQANSIDWTTLGVQSQRRVLLFVGRLDHQKGANLLIDAASQLLPHWPEYDLVLVGEGSERTKLETQVARRGLASRIHFAGWRPDVASCLAAAELVVLPSRYEGMSNVLLEAMAAGKPVVATIVEGVAEVLGPLTQQQTCAAESAPALANAIDQLLRDPRALSTLGEANRARVAEHFSIAAMLKKYADLYKHAVSR